MKQKVKAAIGANVLDNPFINRTYNKSFNAQRSTNNYIKKIANSKKIGSTISGVTTGIAGIALGQPGLVKTGISDVVEGLSSTPLDNTSIQNIYGSDNMQNLSQYSGGIDPTVGAGLKGLVNSYNFNMAMGGYVGKKSGKTLKSPALDVSVGNSYETDKGSSLDVNAALGLWKGSKSGVQQDLRLVGNAKPNINNYKAGLQFNTVAGGVNNRSKFEFPSNIELGLEQYNGQYRPYLSNRIEWNKKRGTISKNDTYGLYSKQVLGGFGYAGKEYRDEKTINNQLIEGKVSDRFSKKPLGAQVLLGVHGSKEILPNMVLSGEAYTDLIPDLLNASKNISTYGDYTNPKFGGNIKLTYKIPYNKARIKTPGHTPIPVTNGQYKNTRLFSDYARGGKIKLDNGGIFDIMPKYLNNIDTTDYTTQIPYKVDNLATIPSIEYKNTPSIIGAQSTPYTDKLTRKPIIQNAGDLLSTINPLGLGSKLQNVGMDEYGVIENDAAYIAGSVLNPIGAFANWAGNGFHGNTYMKDKRGQMLQNMTAENMSNEIGEKNVIKYGVDYDRLNRFNNRGNVTTMNMAKGGGIPPAVFTNPNDPEYLRRKQAFSDSLNVYNKYNNYSPSKVKYEKKWTDNKAKSEYDRLENKQKMFWDESNKYSDNLRKKLGIVKGKATKEQNDKFSEIMNNDRIYQYGLKLYGEINDRMGYLQDQYYRDVPNFHVKYFDKKDTNFQEKGIKPTNWINEKYTYDENYVPYSTDENRYGTIYSANDNSTGNSSSKEKTINQYYPVFKKPVQEIKLQPSQQAIPQRQVQQIIPTTPLPSVLPMQQIQTPNVPQGKQWTPYHHEQPEFYKRDDATGRYIPRSREELIQIYNSKQNKTAVKAYGGNIYPTFAYGGNNQPTIQPQIKQQPKVLPKMWVNLAGNVYEYNLGDGKGWKQSNKDEIMKMKSQYQIQGSSDNLFEFAKGGNIPYKEYSMMNAKEIPQNNFPYNGTSKYKGGYDIKRANELYKPDETGHLPSIDYTNGVWLKEKDYPTSWMEFMHTQLNTELNEQVGFPIVNENGKLQYQKGYSKGGLVPLSATSGTLVGPKHAQGGIDINPQVEAEGGEVMNAQPDGSAQIFSKQDGYADVVKPLLKQKGIYEQQLTQLLPVKEAMLKSFSEETDGLRRASLGRNLEKVNTDIFKYTQIVQQIDNQVQQIFAQQQEQNGNNGMQQMRHGGLLAQKGVEIPPFTPNSNGINWNNYRTIAGKEFTPPIYNNVYRINEENNSPNYSNYTNTIGYNPLQPVELTDNTENSSVVNGKFYEFPSGVTLTDEYIKTLIDDDERSAANRINQKNNLFNHLKSKGYNVELKCDANSQELSDYENNYKNTDLNHEEYTLTKRYNRTPNKAISLSYNIPTSTIVTNNKLNIPVINNTPIAETSTQTKQRRTFRPNIDLSKYSGKFKNIQDIMLPAIELAEQSKISKQMEGLNAPQSDLLQYNPIDVRYTPDYELNKLQTNMNTTIQDIRRNSSNPYYANALRSKLMQDNINTTGNIIDKVNKDNLNIAIQNNAGFNRVNEANNNIRFNNKQLNYEKAIGDLERRSGIIGNATSRAIEFANNKRQYDLDVARLGIEGAKYSDSIGDKYTTAAIDNVLNNLLEQNKASLSALANKEKLSEQEHLSITNQIPAYVEYVNKGNEVDDNILRLFIKLGYNKVNGKWTK